MNVQNHKPKSDILPKIFSVIAAVILWFYVIDVKTTTEDMTVYGVPIVINNFSYNDGLDIVSGKDFTVDVEVRGKKSDLSKLSTQDIYASVNMSGIEHAGTHKMDVDVVCLKSGVTISNKTVSQINVNVDRTIADVVPVETVMLYTIEEDVYEIGKTSLSFENVRITGPQNLVESVDKAKVEINVGKIENSITYMGKIKLFDESGKLVDSPYIKLSDDVVKVEIPVFKTEIKDVIPSFYNLDYDYEYVISPSQIFIKGPVNVVENIKNISTEPISETKSSLVVRKLDLPPNVSAVNSEGNTVDTVRINISDVRKKEQGKEAADTDKNVESDASDKK